MAVEPDVATGDVVEAQDHNVFTDGFGATFDFGVDPTVKDILGQHGPGSDHSTLILPDSQIDPASQAARVVLFSDEVSSAAAEPTPIEYEYTNGGAAGEERRITCFYRFASIQPASGTFVVVTCDVKKDASAQVAKLKAVLTSGDGLLTDDAEAEITDVGSYGPLSITVYPAVDVAWMNRPCRLDVYLRWDGADAGKKAYMQHVVVYAAG